MSTVYEYRDLIKTTLMNKLYFEPLKIVNKKLMELADRNARHQGRDTRGGLDYYAIYYDNKKWVPECVDWLDNLSPTLCLELIPEFEYEMAPIAADLQELIDEKYEADRFITSLMLFAAPPEVFMRILGDTLYSACSDELNEHGPEFASMSWDTNEEHALATYVQDSSRIVEAMNERLMLNLISIPTR